MGPKLVLGYLRSLMAFDSKVSVFHALTLPTTCFYRYVPNHKVRVLTKGTATYRPRVNKTDNVGKLQGFSSH